MENAVRIVSLESGHLPFGGYGEINRFIGLERKTCVTPAVQVLPKLSNPRGQCTGLFRQVAQLFGNLLLQPILFVGQIIQVRP